MSAPETSPANAPSTVGTPPDLRRFWRLLLAVVAPVPALAIAVSTLLTPYPMQGEFADILTGVADSPDQTRIVLWLGLLAVLTMIPATAAVAWVCRRDTPRLASVAAILAVLGFIAAVALPNDDLSAFAAAREGLDRRTMLALNEAMWNQPTTLATLVIFLIGMVVGGVLLGVALWRSRIAPRALSLALVAGSVLHLAPAVAHNAVTALSWLLTAAGFAAASMALVRMSDDEFDLPPRRTAHHR